MRTEKVALILAASLAAGLLPEARAQSFSPAAELNGAVPSELRFAPKPGAAGKQPDFEATSVPRTWGGRAMPKEPAELPFLQNGQFSAEVRAWDYSEALEDGVFGHRPEETLRMLKGYKFLLIPGLGHNNPYFDEVLASLQTVDPQAEVVDVAPFGSIAENAATVAAAIKRRGDKVILIGHSKGGLDLLQALQSDPSLSKRVEMIALLQTPYWGSPLGDSKLSLAVRDILAYLGVQKMVGSTHELLASISDSSRANLPGLPASLTGKIYSVATSLDAADPRRSDPRFLVLPKESDGAVPLVHAIVPCTRYGVFKNMGHMDTVRARPGGLAPKGPGEFTLGVLRWMLDNRRPVAQICS